MTTIKREEKKNLLGLNRVVNTVQGVASPKTVLEEEDIMVIYGDNKDIEGLLNEKERKSL